MIGRITRWLWKIVKPRERVNINDDGVTTEWFDSPNNRDFMPPRPDDTVFTLGNNAHEIVRIGADGSFWIDPEWDLDDAAKLFWEAVEELKP